MVEVMHLQKKLLGDPYTSCNADESYSEEGCAYSKLLNRIVDICECYPTYIGDGVKLILNKSLAIPCGFYEHATCVAFVKVTD